MKNCYVEIMDAGGTILTGRVDYVTAVLIERGALAEGKLAAVCTWTRDMIGLWGERFGVTHSLAKIAPGGQAVMALVPLGVPILLANGLTVRHELAAVPPESFSPGTDDEDPYFAPPDVKFGQATEESDG